MRSDHGRRRRDYHAAIGFDIRLPCNPGADKVCRLLIENCEIYGDARFAPQTISPVRPLVARFTSRLCRWLVRPWDYAARVIPRSVAIQLEAIRIAWEG
jgi:hypothetical protein